MASVNPFHPPGCQCMACQIPMPMFPAPVSPRTLPVNVPISTFGVTVVVLDGEGNLTIKTDQPRDALQRLERD